MLSIDNSRRPSLPCERFHNWYHDLNPQSITLVFPSAYMNNPSSMFGHTLLRIDQKGQTEQTWILAYTIETLVNIVSLSPMDSLFKAPSWKVNIGMQVSGTTVVRIAAPDYNAGISAAV
ncbi:MAG: DUF4105 domain-containing protein [Nitrospirales bacterium]|nr:DUF4105 domain-containing protein [Nitrospirales bacterium]